MKFAVDMCSVTIWLTPVRSSTAIVSLTAFASREQRHHLRSWRCPICHHDSDTQARVARHVAAENPTID